MESEENVTRAEDILERISTVNPTEVTPEDTSAISSGENKSIDPSSTNTGSKNIKNKKEKSLEQQIPKGKPKSGRIWKEQKTRFSSIIKTRGIRLSYEKKKKLKEDLKRSKEMAAEIKARKQAEKEAKKERRKANLKKAEENRKKSEVVQVITNTTKLKNIKRKHLRMIEKRDTLNLKGRII